MDFIAELRKRPTIMDVSELAKIPGGLHESVFRCHGALWCALWLLECGTPAKVVEWILMQIIDEKGD